MFWLMLSLFLIVLFSVMWLLKWVLRKLLNIEKSKREWFSYNHVNKLHGKVNRMIRNITTVVMIGTFYMVIFQERTFIWVALALLVSTIVDYFVRAFFEWKYSDHPKQSILTISELVLIVAFLAVVIQFDLLDIKV